MDDTELAPWGRCIMFTLLSLLVLSTGSAWADSQFSYVIQNKQTGEFLVPRCVESAGTPCGRYQFTVVTKNAKGDVVSVNPAQNGASFDRQGVADLGLAVSR